MIHYVEEVSHWEWRDIPAHKLRAGMRVQTHDGVVHGRMVLEVVDEGERLAIRLRETRGNNHQHGRSPRRLLLRRDELVRTRLRVPS